MTIKFKLRRPQEKQTSVYVEFKKNGQKITLFPGKIIQIEHWHTGNQVCKKNHPAASEMNLFLKTWKENIEKIVLDLESQKKFISKESIQEKLEEIYKAESTTERIKDFIEFMDALIRSKKVKKREVQKLEQTKKLVMIAFKLISPNRLQKWENMSVKEKSQAILKADIKLSFTDINLKFIEKFRDFMYTYEFTLKVNGESLTRHYKINYIDKIVKGLKQVISAAIEEGHVQPFRWTSIKSEDRQVDSVFTDFHEIQLLNDVQLSNETDNLVRDKYVLNCFLGLRYSDLNKLEPHLFRTQTIAGNEFIIYSGRAQKTDQKVEFALHSSAKSILEKYNYNMPKLAASEFNIRIKEVARKAGLTELERIREIRGTETLIRDLPKCDLLSSHAGRRSFCTNFYNEGVSIGAIMSISGHSTEKEFRKYIKKASVRIDVVAQQVLAIQGLAPKLRIA